ncbi:MAG: hypothetical protein JW741_16785 [Sedimentisphaerales bacterium]|nr:hypothetical protein [Sedimentisphaerales bacterium]
MKQIIEDVLQAEAAATAKLKAACEEAAAITAKAEAASLERINEAKQQCQQEMQAIIEESGRAADQVKARMLQEAEEQMGGILSRDSGQVEKLVQAICEMVVGASTGEGVESK